jgi:RHS repeat-associated protein
MRQNVQWHPVNTAAKEETTSTPVPVLLETRVRGFAPKNATVIGPELSVSSTLRWGSWQIYDGTAVDRLVGLDFFGARYFSGAQGRFTSTDPLLNSGHPANPQTWNRYSYALNNPLRYTDPTGMYVWGKCSGSEDECKAEQQRFRDSVANLKKAASQLDGKERKELNKVIKKLGDEGKGNIKINFGDAGSTNGIPNAGLTVGNNITINYAAVDSVKTGWSLNASESSALDAGVTGHEGTHAGGGPSVLGFVGMRGEHPAYWNESLVYQGLHNTDRPFQLWNESWLAVDQQKFPVDKTREQSIQHFLHPDKVSAPVVPPPGGQQ